MLEKHSSMADLIVLRKNSYDNGNSWKDYIPEVDFSDPNWAEEYQRVLDDSALWKEKSLYYYEKLWSPKAVFNFMMKKIQGET